MQFHFKQKEKTFLSLTQASFRNAPNPILLSIYTNPSFTLNAVYLGFFFYVLEHDK